MSVALVDHPAYILGHRCYPARAFNGWTAYYADGTVVRRLVAAISDKAVAKTFITKLDRAACHCTNPCAVDGICGLCGGSMWACCGKADHEAHRSRCHTVRGRVDR